MMISLGTLRLFGDSLRTLRLLWPFVSYFIMPRGPRLDAPGVLPHHGPWNYADAAGDRVE